MHAQKRIADYGIHIGQMPRGPRNKISDVPGVLVGHCTIERYPFNTGVTVVVPSMDDVYYNKPVAAVDVLNGYGKSAGLVQIQELGTIESPIALTNTLNVGLVSDALVQLVLERSHREGRFPTSINPVVMECYDGRLSDIVQRPVRIDHVRSAYENATADFDEGSVGAGRGMICHGLKGGVGSASRVVTLGAKNYALGVLALTNHGHMKDLSIDGAHVGPRINAILAAQEVAERGSVILVLATDLPVSTRQMRRIIRRTSVGLARLGSYIGHGSGEIMLGFTTANRMPFEEGPALLEHRVIRENLLDDAFRAAAECCEEAVLNSMICADTTRGYKGEMIVSLRDIWEKIFS